MKMWKACLFVVSLFAFPVIVAGGGEEAWRLDNEHGRPVGLPEFSAGKSRAVSPVCGNDALPRGLDGSCAATPITATATERSDNTRTYLTIEEAAGCDSARALRALISQVPADERSGDAFNRALIAACRAGNSHCARALLVRGAYNMPVLSKALLSVVKSQASRGRRERLVPLLLEAGADPNYRPRGSLSVLHEAVKNRCPGVVQRLLADSRTDVSDTQIVVDAAMIRKKNEILGCCLDEGDSCSCVCRGNDFDSACCCLSPRRMECVDVFRCCVFLTPVCGCMYLCPVTCCSYLGWRLRLSDDRRIERMLRERYYARQTPVEDGFGSRCDDGEYDIGCTLFCGPCSRSRDAHTQRSVRVME